MAKVVLHIGAHKTGTTFLQNLFHLNRQRLAEDGIHYPHIGPNTAHHVLAAVWLTMPDVPASFFGKDGPEGLWRALTERYASAPGTLFLSAENFSRFYPQAVNMVELAERLSVFEEVKIVYTMRAQAELVQSLWLQQARSGRPPAIYAFVRDTLERRRAGGVRIDHNAVYDSLLKGFSADQIHLLDYGQMRQAPGGVGQTFLNLLGATLTVDMLRHPTREEANISPNPLAYWVSSQIVEGGVPDSELLDRIAAILGAEERPCTLLARHEYHKLTNRYAPANALLVERVQPVQPGFTFVEPGIPENLLYREEISQKQWLDIATAAYGLTSAGRFPLIEFSRLRNRLNLLKPGS